jgi:hypothetical protein
MASTLETLGDSLLPLLPSIVPCSSITKLFTSILSFHLKYFHYYSIMNYETILATRATCILTWPFDCWNDFKFTQFSITVMFQSPYIYIHYVENHNYNCQHCDHFHKKQTASIF